MDSEQKILNKIDNLHKNGVHSLIRYGTNGQVN